MYGLVRSFGQSRSRRQTLRGLAGAGALVALLAAPPGAVGKVHRGKVHASKSQAGHGHPTGHAGKHHADNSPPGGGQNGPLGSGQNGPIGTGQDCEGQCYAALVRCENLCMGDDQALRDCFGQCLDGEVDCLGQCPMPDVDGDGVEE